MSVTTTLVSKSSIARPGAGRKPLDPADLVATLRRFATPDGLERSGDPLECALYNRGWIAPLDESWRDGAKWRPWRITPVGRAWLDEHTPAEAASSITGEGPGFILLGKPTSPCTALVPVVVYERHYQDWQPQPGIRGTKQTLGGVRFWPVDVAPLECGHGFPTPAAARWFGDFVAAGEPLLPRNALGHPIYQSLLPLSVGIGRVSA